MAKDDGFFVNIGSLALSHKAQKILADNSISATVGKRSAVAQGGCSWGVFVKSAKKEQVTLLLRAYSINIL